VSDGAGAGPAEREIDQFARRYAVVSRTAIVAGCGLLGLLIVPRARLLFAACCVAALIGWSAVWAAAMLRRPGNWLLVADVIVFCLVAVGQGGLVPAHAEADGTSWVLAVVSMTVVSSQWHSRPLAGAVTAAALFVAYVTGAQLVDGGERMSWLPTALWIVAEAGCSRGLYLLVRRGGRRSDAQLAARERARSAREVSRARRASEREYLATLHDTAASTLLMVGMGAVHGPGPWLAQQARRDLAAIHGPVPPAGLGTSLTALLTDVIANCGITVHHSPLPPVALPASPAMAIRDSVLEALRNVARHARTAEAFLTLSLGNPLVVEVRDAGCGFDAHQVPPHRRGITESIIGRMSRAGGHGHVCSAPGQGTVVRLEWADG
jgi:signal transduction histidine kinase